MRHIQMHIFCSYFVSLTNKLYLSNLLSYSFLSTVLANLYLYRIKIDIILKICIIFLCLNHIFIYLNCIFNSQKKYVQ